MKKIHIKLWHNLFIFIVISSMASTSFSFAKTTSKPWWGKKNLRACWFISEFIHAQDQAFIESTLSKEAARVGFQIKWESCIFGKEGIDIFLEAHDYYDDLPKHLGGVKTSKHMEIYFNTAVFERKCVADREVCLSWDSIFILTQILQLPDNTPKGVLEWSDDLFNYGLKQARDCSFEEKTFPNSSRNFCFATDQESKGKIGRLTFDDIQFLKSFYDETL